MRYKPSEVAIIVHAGRLTNLSALPNEIGTIDNPVDEGTNIDITVTLTDKQGNVVNNKTLHFYKPDGTEITTGQTNASGQAVFTYIVDVVDDGQQLKVKYLGD